MLLLVDGYNLLYQTDLVGRGRGPRWLERARERLLVTLSTRLDAQLSAETVIVFDAAEAIPGAAAREHSHGLRVLYAVDYAEADDLLEELIAQHPLPRRLTVVSSDHRIQRAARRRRASFFDSEGWYRHLLGDRPPLGIRWPPKSRAQPATCSADKPAAEAMTDQQLAEWLRAFELDPPAREPASPPPDRPAAGGTRPRPSSRSPEHREPPPAARKAAAKTRGRAARGPAPAERPPRSAAERQRARRPLSGPLENPFPENYIDGMEEMP